MISQLSHMSSLQLRVLYQSSLMLILMSWLLSLMYPMPPVSIIAALQHFSISNMQVGPSLVDPSCRQLLQHPLLKWSSLHLARLPRLSSQSWISEFHFQFLKPHFCELAGNTGIPPETRFPKICQPYFSGTISTMNYRKRKLFPENSGNIKNYIKHVVLSVLTTIN